MQVEQLKVGPQFSAARLKPALDFIDGYWKRLERFRPHDEGTLIGLPRPYFVPSLGGEVGFAFDEMYYWDTFFIAQGLIGGRHERLVPGLVENLMSLVERFGLVPNSARFYHMGRSQPPFLSTLVLQAYGLGKSKQWLARAMTVAKQEYRSVWMGTSHPHWRQVFHGLSRFYDINLLDDLAETESGWDMTTRFDRKALSFLPVDLNALLYKYEIDFEKAAVILGHKEEALQWRKRAILRKGMMRKYMWNEEKGCYFDYNFMTGKQGEIYSLAAFFPMWVGMDDPEVAGRMIGNLDRFEEEAGLVATGRQPTVESKMPTQWAYPNGWAPLQLIVVEALERYGYRSEAERLARIWIELNLKWFERTGTFFEKYNVAEPTKAATDGLYPAQVGFGWTNAVFVRLCRQYLRADELPRSKTRFRPVLGRIAVGPVAGKGGLG